VDVRIAGPLALAVSTLCLLTAAPVRAAPDPTPPESFPTAPPGYEVGSREAAAIADGEAVVAEQSDRYGRLETVIESTDDGAWQVGYRAAGREVAQVVVDGGDGSVREAWTGYQVAWPMARGYEGQFGHVLNSPLVWLGLCALFLAGLVDWRRPLRVAHLDLLALLAFGASQVFFNRGEIGVSVPLVYPVLAYLLARALWLGFRGGEPLRPTVPARWLALAAVLLVAFRITINVGDSGVIDVGYAGAVGADRITHGQPLYGEGEFPADNPFGDTYGPVNYLAYVPFELVLPWSGSWDELAASHAAAIAFDLATIAGLVAFALRLRPGRPGRELAAVLAFAWVAYPYTALALQSNSNDSLLAALLAWSLAVFARPIARGCLLALAVMAKFAPLVLLGLYAGGERGLAAARGGGRRPTLVFGAAFAAVCALALVYPALDPGLATFWERTVGSQLGRSSPFSVWGQVAGLGWLQTAVIGLTAVLALALAFVPRRRTIAQVAALAAALLIAAELTAEHWFYLYIPWFAPALLIALAIAARVSPAPARAPG